MLVRLRETDEQGSFIYRVREREPTTLSTEPYLPIISSLAVSDVGLSPARANVNQGVGRAGEGRGGEVCGDDDCGAR